MDPYEFLGRGLKFPLQVDSKTGHIAMVSYEDDIREAIGIILKTCVGERVMNAGFGAMPAEYIFGTTNHTLREDLSSELIFNLGTQELRIEDIEVNVESDSSADQGALLINVAYTVRSTNNRYNHVYPFYMEEGNREESIV